jgi:hypothetical protein
LTNKKSIQTVNDSSEIANKINSIKTIQLKVSSDSDYIKLSQLVSLSQDSLRKYRQGKNNGPDVNKYQDASGTSRGEPWCMAFVYWCFKQACTNLQRPDPGGALDIWNRATCIKILLVDAIINTSLVLPDKYL